MGRKGHERKIFGFKRYQDRGFSVQVGLWKKDGNKDKVIYTEMSKDEVRERLNVLKNERDFFQFIQK